MLISCMLTKTFGFCASFYVQNIHFALLVLDLVKLILIPKDISIEGFIDELPNSFTIRVVEYI